jgi:hypothetical protein
MISGAGSRTVTVDEVDIMWLAFGLQAWAHTVKHNRSLKILDHTEAIPPLTIDDRTIEPARILLSLVPGWARSSSAIESDGGICITPDHQGNVRSGLKSLGNHLTHIPKPSSITHLDDMLPLKEGVVMTNEHK